MRVWVDNDKTIVRCDFAEKDLVKAMGDYKFDKASKTWIFPLKKLVNIIGSLKVDYSPETYAVYEKLLEENRIFHSKINFAQKIKSGEFQGTEEEKRWMAESRLVWLNLDQCMSHQRKMIQLGVLFGSYAFFAQPGCGKSLVAIRLIEFLPKPAIIVSPLSTLENVWMKEFQKWSNVKSRGNPSGLSIVNLWHNLDALNDEHDVYLINYEHFKKLASLKKQKEFKTIVIDESSKMRDNKSEITKCLLRYRNKIPHRFVLSGTPAPNTLMEYHGQMTMVNDQILPENFYQFRNTYFKPVGYGGFQYVLKSGAKDAIMERIGSQAISIMKDDCFDLPEKVFEERSVYMDDIQQKAYDDMMNENILEIGEHVTLAQNQLVKILKLRQITSGWSITTEQIPVLISKSKVNVLLEILNEIPDDKQVIIFCQFHFEINELKKIINSSSCYYGEMNDKEKSESLDAWMNKKTRVLIAHPKSGGIGLNLQQASYMIWFSLSYSQEEFTQACDRIYRKGQNNKCTYFIILGKRNKAIGKETKTIDEVIYDVLLKKQDLMQSCMDMLKCHK